jgi:hypothetical protein
MAADSPAVQNFIAAFHRLRDRVADDPGMVEYEAQGDPSLAKLCRELGLAAFFLRHAQQRRRRLFLAPTAAGFVTVWRDYEARYARPVDGVVLSSTGLLSKSLPLAFDESATDGADAFDRTWEREQEEATFSADAVTSAMALAEDEIELQAEMRHSDKILVGRIRGGVQVWKDLVEADFDLASAFRRRRLTPMAGIPRHASANHDASDPLALIARLQQAQNAFVYGAPLAAVALMRVVLDLVLTNHYAATGNSLLQKIESVKERLPGSITWSQLERLQDLADDAAHLHPQRSRDVKDEEREIVALLNVLQSLIESEPQSLPRR